MTELSLDANDRALLCQIARSAICRELGHEISEPDAASEVLNKRHGLFVTVKIRDRLRGCIGTIEGDQPLAQEVASMARAAAFGDPRFNPIRPDELAEMSIEVSVLSPLEQISGPEDIETGTHGLLIERDHTRGLLLPQVAAEHGWDADTFLQHTCDKAGLPPDAWRDASTNIYAFTATVISEE